MAPGTVAPRPPHPPTTLDQHRRRLAGPPAAAPPGSGTRVRVLVCHPAPLAGQAIAASVRSSAAVTDVEVVVSATDLLRAAARGCDVALVSEALGPELAELVQAMAYRGLAVPVVVATTVADPDLAAEYLEWGAAGSVDVRRAVADVVAAIRVAATGAPVVDERIAGEIVRSLEYRAGHRETARALLGALTARERSVIESLARGTGVAEIAHTLHLSPHTIRACIRTLGPKLGVTGQLQIASVARELMVASRPPAASRHLQRVRASDTTRWQLSG